jgi:cell division septal protein FtsQ
MRKKRKRRSLRPKPVLWSMLIVLSAIGIWVSPLTAIRRVRIQGALEADRARLESIVASLRDVPCIRIDPRAIEAAVMTLPEIKSADLTRNPFGSALLKVGYRVPVARLLGSPNLLLSEDGVLYPASSVPEGLPQIQLPRGGPPTLATLSGNWEPQKVSKLAQISRTLGSTGVIRIQMSDSGVVSLNLGTERVILGSLDDLDKKISVLKQRMATYPDELAQNEALNLTWPDAPSLIPRRGGR